MKSWLLNISCFSLIIFFYFNGHFFLTDFVTIDYKKIGNDRYEKSTLKSILWISIIVFLFWILLFFLPILLPIGNDRSEKSAWKILWTKSLNSEVILIEELGTEIFCIWKKLTDRSFSTDFLRLKVSENCDEFVVRGNVTDKLSTDFRMIFKNCFQRGMIYLIAQQTCVTS